MATLITVNGEIIKLPGPISLEKARELIGGYVEVVRIPDDPEETDPEENRMLVDEDGRMKELQINMQASIIAMQTIVGNALIVEPGEGWHE